MDLQEFLGLAIVGGLLSLALEFFTKKFGATGSKIATLIGALIVGGLYAWLKNSAYYESVVFVLGSASTVYALFVKK